jgi:hypothetical protein
MTSLNRYAASFIAGLLSGVLMIFLFAMFLYSLAVICVMVVLFNHMV